LLQIDDDALENSNYRCIFIFADALHQLFSRLLLRRQNDPVMATAIIRGLEVCHTLLAIALFYTAIFHKAFENHVEAGSVNKRTHGFEEAFSACFTGFVKQIEHLPLETRHAIGCLYAVRTLILQLQKPDPAHS